MKQHPQHSSIFKQFANGRIGSSSMPPLWAASWIVENQFLFDDQVYCMQENMVVFEMTKMMVDIFFSLVKDNGYEKALLLSEDLSLIAEPKYDFRFVLEHKHIEKENGQLKLLTNMLDTLDGDISKILVIGGGGPPYCQSGMSYECLQILDKPIVVYDPMEISRVDKNITWIGEPYDYKTVVSGVSHIIDDVYIESNKERNIEWISESFKNNVSYHYSGKISFLKQHDCIIAVETPHKHEGVGIIGGGHIVYNGTQQVVYGSSSGYGGYDYKFLRKYTVWIVVPSSAYHNAETFKWLVANYPTAKISAKALRKISYKGIIADQHYYTGNEQRVYHRVDPIVSKICTLCDYVKQASMRLHITEAQVRDMFVKVGSAACGTYPFRKKKYLINLARNMASKHSLLNDIVEVVQHQGHHNEITAKSLVMTLVSSYECSVVEYDKRQYLVPRHIQYVESMLPRHMDYDKLIYLSYVFQGRVIGDVSLGRGDARIAYTSERSTLPVVASSSMPAHEKIFMETTHKYYPIVDVFVSKMIDYDFSEVFKFVRRIKTIVITNGVLYVNGIPLSHFKKKIHKNICEYWSS